MLYLICMVIKMNNKKRYLIISIGVLLFLVIGASYALWQLTKEQTNYNEVATGCLNIDFNQTGIDGINLPNTFPLKDDEGESLTPYEFTIVNNCNSYASYTIQLEVKNTSQIDDKYIKMQVDTISPKTLDKYATNQELVKDNTKSDAYIIDSGILDGGQSKSYSIRLWLDESVTLDSLNTDGSKVENGIWNGYVTLTAKNALRKDSYSIYNWDKFLFDDANIDSVIADMKKMSINTVYHSFNDNDFADGTAQKIVSKLKENNIDTYVLTGDTVYYNNVDKYKKSIDLVANYNNSNDIKIKGVVYDVEPYVLEEYKLDVINSFETLANTIESAYQYAKSNNVEMVNVIPYWYDNYITGEEYDETAHEKAKNSLEKIIINSDIVSVMNYYKNSMAKNIEYELGIAQTHKKKIESIAEFTRPRGEDIPENITMWVEPDPFNEVLNQWKQISSKNSYENLIYSYHDLASILTLKNKYVDINLEFTSGDAPLTDVEYYIVFENGKAYSSTKSSVTLPIDKNYSIYLKDYAIIDDTSSTSIDHLINESIKLEAKDKYTLEVYSHDKNNSSLSDGSIIIRDPIIQSETEKNITSGYAVFSNVYSDTNYEVVYKINNQEYPLTKATTKNDSDVEQDIYKDGYLYLEKGIKSTKYLGPKFYFNYAAESVAKETYNIDVYLRDTSEQYLKIDSSSVTITDLETSTPTVKPVTVAGDGSYIYSFSLSSDTKYSVSVDLNGQSYTITGVKAKDDSGAYVSLNVDDDVSKFLIPTGFKTSSKSTNLRIYLQKN